MENVPVPSAPRREAYRHKEEPVVLERRIRHLLEQENVQKVNEGTEGVIFHVPSEELTDLPIISDEQEPTGDGAMKILKIERKGLAGEEGKLQRMAFDILEAARKQTKRPIARVPKLYASLDLPLEENTRKKLETCGLGELTEAQAILMEFIPGKDMGRLLYEEVLKHHPITKQTIPHPEELTQEILEYEVGALLHFTSYNDLPLSGLSFQTRLGIEQDNANKLMRFFAQSDFVLPEGIWEQIHNALEILHKKGLYLRDLHLRNVMIAGSDAYIIDYGKAAIREDAIDPYREEDVRFIPDSFILPLLEQLSPTRLVQKKQEEQARKKRSMMERIAKLETTANWKRLVHFLQLWISSPEGARRKMPVLIKISSDQVADVCLGLLTVAKESPNMRLAILHAMQTHFPITRRNGSEQHFIDDCIEVIRTMEESGQ